MRSLFMLFVTILALTLSACATQCKDTRARVSFIVHGESYEQQRHSMLVHSARTTLSRGYQYFSIIKTEYSPIYGSNDNPYNYMNRPLQPVSYHNRYGQPVRKFESTVLINMFNCSDIINVYNAREILGQ